MNGQVELIKVDLQKKEKYKDFLLMADESEEVVNQYISRGEMFSLQFEKKIVGVILFMEESPEIIELKNIAILPSYRGKGFGKEAIKSACLFYRKKSYRKMLVGTANSSIDNIAFYQKCGFRIVGIRKDFFISYPEPIFENGIQAIDMLMFEKKLFI
ncbi:GNAT family N-acetyltransferase [Cytobacillus sp. Hz8]|uniref:GNAT family N-acetyltransferase n=1 Tax=Cytobacillus sp. Hz8 TaxID=3347168 RepID=UPI0035DF779C